jgi:AraC family transcriptional activator FtrA
MTASAPSNTGWRSSCSACPGRRWAGLVRASPRPPSSRATCAAWAGCRMVADGGLELLEQASVDHRPRLARHGHARAPPLIEALRDRPRQGARLMSICSGVFVLAAAGLLDGAAGHHPLALCRHALRARYPDIEVQPDVLYVDEGDLLTSAGSAAGIDLGLHLMRRDFGPEAANTVARRLVIPPHRDGGQAQFVERPVPTATRPRACRRSWTACAATCPRAHGQGPGRRGGHERAHLPAPLRGRHRRHPGPLAAGRAPEPGPRPAGDHPGRVEQIAEAVGFGAPSAGTRS